MLLSQGSTQLCLPAHRLGESASASASASASVPNLILLQGPCPFARRPIGDPLTGTGGHHGHPQFGRRQDASRAPKDLAQGHVLVSRWVYRAGRIVRGRGTSRGARRGWYRGGAGPIVRNSLFTSCQARSAVDPSSSSSQPWPYPANIMVGCFGRAKDGQTIRLDLDNELEGVSSASSSVFTLLRRVLSVPLTPQTHNGSRALSSLPSSRILQGATSRGMTTRSSNRRVFPSKNSPTRLPPPRESPMGSLTKGRWRD